MAFTFKHGDRPLDEYTIQRAVGRGGFGEVYYAVSDGGREVALKYLRENPHIELRGVSHCMNLKSPHLITIFDVKKNADGEYFIVMEYSSGPSLRDLLMAEPNGLGPQKAAFFLRELAKGLGYLHDQGIVHRDLKPGNIFYDEGYVKIGDYGLSKFISVSRHSAQTASVGTVHYMAPEVGSGNYHRGIDLYALGVILYEMLLGKVPFEGGSMGEVLMKHLTQQPEVADLPAPFGKIIQKALEKDPKDRYQTVYEMVEDLLEVEDVKASLAGFNPVSLAGIARRGTGDPADSPVRSPNPAPTFAPPPVPPPRRRFDLDARELPPKLAKRVRQTSEKVEQRVRKLEAKFGPRAAPPPPTHRGAGPPGHGRNEALTRGEVIQRLLLALAMTVGLGFGLGLLVNSREEGVLAAIFLIAGMSAGLALGCRCVAFLARRSRQPRWVERICFAGPIALMAGPGAGIFSDCVRDDRALGVWAGLVAAAFFVCWGERVRAGARGELSIGKALWAGLFALIATAVLTEGHEQSIAMAAGVTAASSLVLQALAWLFPLARWLHGIPAGNEAPPGDDRSEPIAPAAKTDPWFDPDSGEVARQVDALLPEPSPDSDETPPEFLADPRPRRWGITRFFGALLALGCMVGIVLCLAYVGTGPKHSYSYTNTMNGMVHVRHVVRNEFTGVIALGAALFGLMLFAFRKVTRYPTGGFYRDTLRPLLLALVLAGLAFSASGLLTEWSGGGFHGPTPKVLRLLLVTSGLFFGVLLLLRGRRNPHSHPPKGE